MKTGYHFYTICGEPRRFIKKVKWKSYKYYRNLQLSSMKFFLHNLKMKKKKFLDFYFSLPQKSSNLHIWMRYIFFKVMTRVLRPHLLIFIISKSFPEPIFFWFESVVFNLKSCLEKFLYWRSHVFFEEKVLALWKKFPKIEKPRMCFFRSIFFVQILSIKFNFFHLLISKNFDEMLNWLLNFWRKLFSVKYYVVIIPFWISAPILKTTILLCVIECNVSKFKLEKRRRH